MLSLAITLSDTWNYLNKMDAAQIKALAANNMGLALVVCFLSGILTSLTPCIYPMIPITINIFGRMAQTHATQNRLGFNPYSFRMAVIYVAGMCATYSMMGLVAGLTGSVFGTALQSGWMLLFLCVLFGTLALGQLGLFKIQLPVALQSKLASAGGTHSAFGVFTMGLIAGLVVSPCVGPVIAGILAFVFDSSSAFTGFFYFFSFSLGLGVLFLVIGAFSGLVNKIPRSGSWMVRVNYILATLLLVAAGYYGFLFAKRMGIIGGELTQTARTQGGGLDWKGLDVYAAALKDHRPMVIDFSAEWCEACHVIDKTVFHDPKVMEKMKDLTLVRIDMTSSLPSTDEIAKQYEVFGLPAVLFIGADGKPAKARVTGVLTAQEFLQMLASVAQH